MNDYASLIIRWDEPANLRPVLLAWLAVAAGAAADAMGAACGVSTASALNA